jgi:hypothetical protein
MNERRRIILLGILVIVAAYWAYFTINRRAEQREKQAQLMSETAPPPAQAATIQDPDSSAIAELTILPWGKDPFYHNYSPPKKKSVQRDVHLRLLGILHNDQSPQALINGRIVSVGERIEGYTVIRITKKYVELTGAGGVRRLQVNEASS